MNPPRNVQIFFWLTVALTAYWAATAAAFVIHPSQHYLAVLATLPDDQRHAVQEADIKLTIGRTVLWSMLLLGLAFLATYRRQNWARWTILGLFLIGEALPFGMLFYHPRFADFWSYYVSHYWTSPMDYVLEAAKLAIIVFVFAGDAGAWFRKAPPIP